MRKRPYHIFQRRKVTNISTFSSPRATICGTTVGKYGMRWRVIAVGVLTLPSSRNEKIPENIEQSFTSG